MARNPAEIKADIALTRRVIERQLDALSRRLPHTRWTPWLTGAGALAVGLLLSRMRMRRLVGAGVRAVRGGIAVAGTVAVVDRFLAGRRRPAA